MKTKSQTESEKVMEEWQAFKKDTKVDLWLYGATAAMAGAAVAFALVGIFMGYYLSGVITPIVAVGIAMFARHTMQKQLENRTDAYAYKCWKLGRTFEKKVQKLPKELAKNVEKMVK